MTTFISNSQPTYSLADGESIVVLACGSLTSQSGAALLSASGNATIRLAGTLAGTTGIALGGASGSYSTVGLSATAAIFSTSHGMVLDAGEMRLKNAGTIMADGAGLAIGSAGSGLSMAFSLTNTGLISGQFGVYVYNSANPYVDATVVNYGTILGANEGVPAYMNEHVSGLDRIVNYGTFGGAVMTNGMADSITNRGHILGGIIAGDGDDMVHNLRSLDDSNVIDLGAGNDVVYLGRAEEFVGGGSGFDIASYRFGRAVRVDLTDPSRNTGGAEGDVLNGIEQISGAERYGDTLIGDDGANRLFGDGGADVLSGGGGNDTLEGGTGADRLTGGGGNDRFVLWADENSADRVTDFSNVTGNNDLIQVSASWLGLNAGAIAAGNFRARADNQAQDADDFFIFRTTDKTLWLDSNGSDEGGLVLLADLQDSASMTYRDIVMLAY